MESESESEGESESKTAGISPEFIGGMMFVVSFAGLWGIVFFWS